jgi:hypothetical protein
MGDTRTTIAFDPVLTAHLVPDREHAHDAEVPNGDNIPVTDRFPPRRDPRIPLGDVVGRPVGDVVGLYRADGFRVEIVDADHTPVMTLEFSPDRIRLIARAGRVVRAVQG